MRACQLTPLNTEYSQHLRGHMHRSPSTVRGASQERIHVLYPDIQYELRRGVPYFRYCETPEGCMYKEYGRVWTYSLYLPGPLVFCLTRRLRQCPEEIQLPRSNKTSFQYICTWPLLFLHFSGCRIRLLRAVPSVLWRVPLLLGEDIL